MNKHQLDVTLVLTGLSAQVLLFPKQVSFIIVTLIIAYSFILVQAVSMANFCDAFCKRDY
jgi:hypothetical protein